MTFRIIYQNLDKKDSVEFDNFDKNEIEKILSKYEVLEIVVINLKRKEGVEMFTNQSVMVNEPNKIEQLLSVIEPETIEDKPMVENVEIVQNTFVVEKSRNIQETSDFFETEPEYEVERKPIIVNRSDKLQELLKLIEPGDDPEKPIVDEKKKVEHKKPEVVINTPKVRGRPIGTKTKRLGEENTKFFSDVLSDLQISNIVKMFKTKQIIRFKNIARSLNSRNIKISELLKAMRFPDDNSNYFLIASTAIYVYENGDSLDEVTEKIINDIGWMSKGQVNFNLVFGIKNYLKKKKWQISLNEFIHTVSCLLEGETYR